MSPNIVIIGAGPSCLVLASLFHRHQIPFKIYDLRPRPSPYLVNIPSGSLDLHPESGQLALSECGLLEGFRSITVECSEEHIICDRYGDIKFKDSGHGGGRPEISRNSLIELLLSSIPENIIKWEHKITSVFPNPANSQQQIITFQDGSTHTCDLVIGADGAWSKVRALLTDAKPFFSGVHCLTLTIPHATERFPDMAKMVGTGTFWALGSKRAILTQRGSMDSVRVYVTTFDDVDYWKNTIGHANEKLLEKSGAFGDFGEGVKDLLARGLAEEKDAEFLQMYMLPTDHTWEHKANATLVGDAAHLMTPFAGEGVNSAMLDAVELAQWIISAVKNETSISDSVKEYEIRMFSRARDNAEETETNLKNIFQDDAPKKVVEWFNSMGPPPSK